MISALASWMPVEDAAFAGALVWPRADEMIMVQYAKMEGVMQMFLSFGGYSNRAGAFCEAWQMATFAAEASVSAGSRAGFVAVDAY